MHAVLFAADAASQAGYTFGRYLPGMILGGIVGAIIGAAKGRTGLGFVLGALLGCIGWLIMGFMGKKHPY